MRSFDEVTAHTISKMSTCCVTRSGYLVNEKIGSLSSMRISYNAFFQIREATDGKSRCC